MLLIDASNSMAGKPIASAMAAARAFAARRNPGQRLALVTFNDKVDGRAAADERSEPRSTKALAKEPPLANGTHIYDALEQAGHAAAGRGHHGRLDRAPLRRQGRRAARSTRRPRSTASTDAQGPRLRGRAALRPVRPRDAAGDRRRRRRAPTPRRRAPRALSQIYSELGYTLSQRVPAALPVARGAGRRSRSPSEVKGIAGVPHARRYTTPPLPTLVAVPRAVDAGIGSSGRRSRCSSSCSIVVSLIGYAVFRLVYRPDQALTRRIGQFVTLPEDERAACAGGGGRSAASRCEAVRRGERWTIGLTIGDLLESARSSSAAAIRRPFIRAHSIHSRFPGPQIDIAELGPPAGQPQLRIVVSPMPESPRNSPAGW